MKTKQTAMQELIKEMESLKNMKPYVNPQNALRDCISLAYLKLGMEKEQIEDAHIEGQRVFDNYQHTQWTTDQAEQYYNETYGGEE